MESNHVTYFQRVVSAPIDLPGISFKSLSCNPGNRTQLVLINSQAVATLAPRSQLNDLFLVQGTGLEPVLFIL